MSPFSDRRTIKLLLSAVFVAIFGGFWLFLAALKHIDASIAVILNETAPLFVLPLSFFMLKEKIPLRGVIGAAVAVSGVTLIFIR